MEKQNQLAKYNELKTKKEELKQEIIEIDKELTLINNLQKPYVANADTYHRLLSTQFDTEEKARKKLREYAGKERVNNGLNFGVYLYKWNEDGTRTLLESIPLGSKSFKAPDLNKDINRKEDERS